MDEPKKTQPVGSFADMMAASEKQKNPVNVPEKERKNESSKEQKNVITKEPKKERVIKHHSFDVFIDQLIDLDFIRTKIYQEKGKKPKISSLMQEALDDFIKKQKK